VQAVDDMVVERAFVGGDGGRSWAVSQSMAAFRPAASITWGVPASKRPGGGP
jgi:hypothetical protein